MGKDIVESQINEIFSSFKRIRVEDLSNGDQLHWYALPDKVVIVQVFGAPYGWTYYIDGRNSNVDDIKAEFTYS